MNAQRGLCIAAVLAFLLSGIAWNPPAAAAADRPVLTPDDCIKCHEGPPADVAAGGGKHKSDVTCLDCHSGHRPASKDNIPKCANCHEGKPHFSLKGCLDCHKNPHRPLSVTIAGKVTDPCLTCHTDQIKQLKENPSRHSSQYCSTCHPVHRQIPECVKCHKPHSAEMSQADCRKCHKAHRPKAVAYGGEVPNKDCGACHKSALALLSATQTRHREVACVRCHADRHRTVPQCQQCHTKAHPAGIMKKFSKCGICHNTAHDLNNFAEVPKKPAAARPHKRTNKP